MAKKRGRPVKKEGSVTVMEKPVEAKTPRGRIPGSTVNRTKVPWNYSDMAQFPKVLVVPPESITITWNGLQFRLRQDEENWVPEPIREQYRQYVAAARIAHRPPPGITFEPGVGALPPDL